MNPKAAKARAKQNKDLVPLPGAILVEEPNAIDHLGRYAPLLTLIVLVAGGVGKYYLLDRPAAERAELQTRLEMDRVWEEIVPFISIDVGNEANWSRHSVELPISFTNMGKRSVGIGHTITLTLGSPTLELDATLPGKDQITIKTCDVNYLKPGETGTCFSTLYSEIPIDAADRLEYVMSVDSRSDLMPEMETSKQLTRSYTPERIEARLKRNTSDRGTVGR